MGRSNVIGGVVGCSMPNLAENCIFLAFPGQCFANNPMRCGQGCYTGQMKRAPFQFFPVLNVHQSGKNWTGTRFGRRSRSTWLHSEAEGDF